MAQSHPQSLQLIRFLHCLHKPMVLRFHTQTLPRSPPSFTSRDFYTSPPSFILSKTWEIWHRASINELLRFEHQSAKKLLRFELLRFDSLLRFQVNYLLRFGFSLNIRCWGKLSSQIRFFHQSICLLVLFGDEIG